MKTGFVVLFVCLICFAVIARDTAHAQSEKNPQKVDVCLSCHNQIVSLKDRGIDVIIKQTKVIKTTDRPHPPSGINELSEEEIEAIAAILDKA